MMQPWMTQNGQHFPQQHVNRVFAPALQPQQQELQTHIEVKVAVPEGAVPGQRVFCTLPDGRRAMVVAQEHLEPGSSMAVRFPSQLPSQQPQSQPQQTYLQPPLAAPLLSPLPETDVSLDDDQAATRYWWAYGLSWLACCVAPWMGACMMFCMTVHYFCIKTAQERASRPRQGLAARVAAATLGAKCMCVALAIFVGSMLYIACGNDLDKCPGLSMHLHRLHPGHHHRHGMTTMGDEWEGHPDWHHHGQGDHVHPGYHHWHHHVHGDRNDPGFDVSPRGNALPKCQACLASGFDYCIREDRCTKRATYTCKGPHDHITGDEEFALHGNPHTQHSMICPGFEPKGPVDFSAVATSKEKGVVQEHKPCKMKKHLLKFASAVKSLLGTKHVGLEAAAEKTASVVV